ncbi:Hypothetical predicted protein [Pelobates cultripes]|uniref:Uncharacterized protein n=1 Tax=Pelobates cultripes TaxID=61616 RepID=A0AAD1W3L6_PELCU|nr:Hypothetical predicted protein [Pelobates cultripes]
MAPPKAQRALDFFRQGRRDRQRSDQDGGGSHSPAHNSDAGSNNDSRQTSTGNLSVSEKRLAAMLQERRTSMRTDFQTAVSDMRKDLLEDRSRRKNICVRGVLEKITHEELPSYLLQLFQAIQPTVEPADLCLDRAHSVPKPNNQTTSHKMYQGI